MEKIHVKKTKQAPEQKIIKALKRAPLTIRQLARVCFPNVRPIAKADSRVRNALRRPRAAGAIRLVARGTYETVAR